jgi:hypothetical protein
MKFVVVFHYIDKETFEVEIHPDDIAKFVESVGRGEVYYNETRGKGIWIPIEKIRYFSLESVDAKGNHVKLDPSVLQKANEDN